MNDADKRRKMAGWWEFCLLEQSEVSDGQLPLFDAIVGTI